MFVVATVLMIVAGCGGDSVDSEDEWNTSRQVNIDRVTEVAHRLSSKVFSVGEEIGACERGDDLDRSIGQSDYLVTGAPAAGTLEYVTGELKARMAEEGWKLRDRSGTDHPLDLLWSKDGFYLNVLTLTNSSGQSVVNMSGGTPCGKTGSIRHGQVSEDDPWYLAPTVDGPTIRDND